METYQKEELFFVSQLMTALALSTGLFCFLSYVFVSFPANLFFITTIAYLLFSFKMVPKYPFFTFIFVTLNIVWTLFSSVMDVL